jgi:hypothetical protein
MALVLGDTVDNLRWRMSNREFNGWLAYRKKWGPLNPMRRFDRPAALISVMLNHAHGGKAEMTDYLPWPVEELSEEEAFWRGL